MAPPKGKQGTKGNKQILEENQQTIKFYTYMACGATAIYFVVNSYFKWETFTAARWFGFTVTEAIYFGAVQFLVYMSKAKLAEDGKLLDGGLDLNMESGVAEHVKDLIILTAVCQVASIISTYFWLMWLLVPGRAFYMLWTNVLGPWFFQPTPEVGEKKQKKMEKKMARRQHF